MKNLKDVLINEYKSSGATTSVELNCEQVNIIKDVLSISIRKNKDIFGDQSDIDVAQEVVELMTEAYKKFAY